MLYTITPPSHEIDRVRLYPDTATAAALAGDSGTYFAVAVRFDERSRRVFPTHLDHAPLDPTWSTPAELHSDGTVTAKGTIPEALYVNSSAAERNGHAGTSVSVPESLGSPTPGDGGFR